jgi:hypothetical protein
MENHDMDKHSSLFILLVIVEENKYEARAFVLENLSQPSLIFAI